MLEGPSKDTDLIWDARLEGMAPDIDGKVYITEFEGVNDARRFPAPGTLATVEITGTKDYDLIGRVVEFAPPPSTNQIPLPAKDPVSDPGVQLNASVAKRRAIDSRIDEGANEPRKPTRIMSTSRSTGSDGAGTESHSG